MKYNQLFPVLLLFVFGFSFVGISRAANFTVNNNGDTSDTTPGNGMCVDASGNCTLRAAVEEANTLSGNDTIDFAASLTNATITLATGVEIAISGTNGTLQINGLGADKLTIDGGAGSNRIFLTSNSAAVTITGVTLQGGNGNSPGQQGGAIYANGGSLVLIAVLVQNNIVTDRGGGIYYNGGTNHRILNSAISGNKAFVGGGLYLSGATLFVANTTVSGNNVTPSGSAAGGVYISGGSTATFRNSTISNNTASGGGSGGGGVQVSGALNFGNTIIAGNSAPSLPDIFNFGGAVSAGNNFVGNTSTNVAIAYQMSDILNQNPSLGVLQNNGGTTPTHALLMGSLAINAGDNAKAVDPFNNSPLTTDQRIVALRIVGGTVDIGAYELNSATAASVVIGGRVTVGERGLAQARVTLTDMNGDTRDALTDSLGYYSFEDVAAGETYILSVFNKRYTFAQPSQVLNASDDTTEINFIGNSEKRRKVF